jgi:hypothetical protein
LRVAARTKIPSRASNYLRILTMNRQDQLINDCYEAMMFAKTSEAARKAARELAVAVLGEAAANRPLEEALRECCRVFRPAADPKEQARFEAEFLELALWPTAAQTLAA